MTTRSLANRRIVVTRAASQAQPLVDLLLAEGAVPIRFPVLAIMPSVDETALTTELAVLCPDDWIVFTSANAVRAAAPALARHVSQAGHRPRFAVIGPATAAALNQVGFEASLCAAQHTSEGLLNEMQTRTYPPETRWLILNAEEGRPLLADALREQGSQVTVLPLYRIDVDVPPAEAFADIQQGVDAYTFASPSAVKNTLSLLGNTIHKHARIACIGPITAQYAADCGLRVDMVAASHTMQGLVHSLRHYYT